MIRTALPCLGLLFLTTALPAQQDSEAKTVKPEETRDIVYVAEGTPGYAPKSQRLDVFRNTQTPRGKRAPVLVYIHGGAWNHGDKPASWGGFRPWLAEGFSVVNIEYRLVDVAPAPAAVQDVRCALSWIKANADKFGFDADRVVTYGTSAGGHLALLAAVLPKDSPYDLQQCKAQAKVVAVLDFYGPYHLEPDQPGAFKSPSTAKWIGTSEQPALYMMEHAMSPSTYIHKGIPPVFLSAGDADPTVPYEASVTLKKDLDAAGIVSAFDTVPGGGHGKWTPEEQHRVDADSIIFLKKVGVLQ